MSYYDFHIKSLGFSHYHMNKPPFSLHYLKIFPQSNMAKTLNIYHFRPFHTIAPGVGSRLCLLWRNRGARHQQRRLECPAFFCCPDMGLFENKMPPHRLLKKSQFLFKLFWDSVFIFSDGQVRCVFPLFIPFFSTSTLSTFQTWNAGGSWWLKIITDFLRFWDLHKKLGECYQADLQLASDAWSKTSGQQILWWTGNAEVFVNPRKRCGKVKSTPKLSIN